MDLDIEGNTALVTASSSGLGKASAKALSREGVNVVINGRDEKKLESTVRDISSVGKGDIIGQVADITNAEEIEGLVERTVDEFGRLDHLITSAGGPTRMSPLQADDEDWYQAYDLLVMSVVRTVRAAEPHLRSDGGGTIVNITSRIVKEGRPGNTLSSSVRMAVVGFEKTLSKELAPSIRANAILPGSHETPRVTDGLEESVKRGEFSSYNEAYQDRVQEIPVGRIGDPMETGDMVAYLSSPRSGFTNGQAIVIDGGQGSSTL